ncbi:MAG: glycosyltransferase [Pseudomonadota bacterium]
MDRSLRDLIEQSGVFHRAWYTAAYPDVAASDRDPFEHYLKHGYREDRSPHPLFNAQHYKREYADIAKAGMPSIAHYLRNGGREKRAPSPLVDLETYYDEYGDAVSKTETGTILEDFCRSDDRSAALQFFDEELAIEQIKAAGAGAPTDGFNRLFEAFFVSSLPKGGSPNSLVLMDGLPDDAPPSERYDMLCRFFAGDESSLVRAHGFLDADFVRERCEGDLSAHPLLVYLRAWRKERFWPNPLFDAEYYRRSNSAAIGASDPLSHYVREGEQAGLRPNAWFDPAKYRERYGDTFGEHASPLTHYNSNGHQVWFEPSDEFGQRYYLSRYPEAAAAAERGVSVLSYFLHHGIRKGDAPLPSSPELVETDADIEFWFSGRDWSDVEASPDPQVTVIVPAYQHIDFTLRCVKSLLEARTETSFEILVVDDASPDGSGARLAGLLEHVPGVSVKINAENLGFLRTCNTAVATTRTDYVCLLNNDATATDDWLDELVGVFDATPRVGLAGSKLIYPNGLLQEAGGILWDGGTGANYGRLDDPAKPEFNFRRDADYISGAAILVKREAWDAVEGLTDDLAPAYYEDSDLAMKLRADGWRVIYQPLSTIVHHEGISSGTDETKGVKKYQTVNREKFSKTWSETLARFGDHGDFSRKTVDRAPRSRILVFDACTPTPDRDSGSITAFFQMKILCELGHRVTFVPENLRWEGRYSRDLQRIGVEVIHNPYAENAREFLLKEGGAYDVFFMARAATGGEFMISLKERFPEKAYVFDTVDIHHLRLMRQYETSRDPAHLSEAVRLKTLELNAIRNADATIVTSEFEARYLRDEVGPFAKLVLPLIYDDHAPKTGYAERTDVAFVGGYNHPPNVDAAMFLTKEIWPRFRAKQLDARLHLIGSDMPPEIRALACDDVMAIGFVEDLEAYLAQVRMTVAPLRFGAGVKGKVGNSLRMGVPVVATPIAIEGMGLVSGRDVLVGETAQAFSDQMARLYKDEATWAAMARAGRVAARERFGYEQAKKRLKTFTEALI